MIFKINGKNQSTNQPTNQFTNMNQLKKNLTSDQKLSLIKNSIINKDSPSSILKIVKQLMENQKWNINCKFDLTNFMINFIKNNKDYFSLKELEFIKDIISQTIKNLIKSKRFNTDLKLSLMNFIIENKWFFSEKQLIFINNVVLKNIESLMKDKNLNTNLKLYLMNFTIKNKDFLLKKKFKPIENIFLKTIKELMVDNLNIHDKLNLIKLISSNKNFFSKEKINSVNKIIVDQLFGFMKQGFNKLDRNYQLNLIELILENKNLFSTLEIKLMDIQSKILKLVNNNTITIAPSKKEIEKIEIEKIKNKETIISNSIDENIKDIIDKYKNLIINQYEKLETKINDKKNKYEINREIRLITNSLLNDMLYQNTPFISDHIEEILDESSDTMKKLLENKLFSIESRLKIVNSIVSHKNLENSKTNFITSLLPEIIKNILIENPKYIENKEYTQNISPFLEKIESENISQINKEEKIEYEIHEEKVESNDKIEENSKTSENPGIENKTSY